MAKAPDAPSDLAPRGRGRRFWRAVTADFEVSGADLELLGEACRVLDELESLREVLARDGPTSMGSKGQVVTHPALGALNQSRAELRRLIDQLGIPEAPDAGEDGELATLTSRKASKAARTRWASRGSHHA